MYLDSENPFIIIDLTPQPVKSNKNSWKYTNLKIESCFQERLILAILG